MNLVIKFQHKTDGYYVAYKPIKLSCILFMFIEMKFIHTDPIAIGVETLRIDSGCSLEKEFTQLIRMNPSMVLYLTVNQVDSCHDCVCGPLT